ncbi:MAG: hypothetical protein ACK4M7_02515 [Burkholderiales bacterium]
MNNRMALFPRSAGQKHPAKNIPALKNIRKNPGPKPNEPKTQKQFFNQPHQDIQSLEEVTSCDSLDNSFDFEESGSSDSSKYFRTGSLDSLGSSLPDGYSDLEGEFGLTSDIGSFKNDDSYSDESATFSETDSEDMDKPGINLSSSAPELPCRIRPLAATSFKISKLAGETITKSPRKTQLGVMSKADLAKSINSTVAGSLLQQQLTSQTAYSDISAEKLDVDSLLDKLPNEILELIYYYLGDPRNAAALILSCKAFFSKWKDGLRAEKVSEDDYQPRILNQYIDQILQDKLTNSFIRSRRFRNNYLLNLSKDLAQLAKSSKRKEVLHLFKALCAARTAPNYINLDEQTVAVALKLCMHEDEKYFADQILYKAKRSKVNSKFINISCFGSELEGWYKKNYINISYKGKELTFTKIMNDYPQEFLSEIDHPDLKKEFPMFFKQSFFIKLILFFMQGRK